MNNKKNANQKRNIKIDTAKVNSLIESIKDNQYQKRYEEFNNDVLKADFDVMSVADMQTMYNDGASLLDEYYLICEDIKCDSNIIMKMHYSMNQLAYYINISTNNELTKAFEKQKNINNKLTRTANAANNNIKNTRKQLDSIITTMISIILTISVITAAIVGVEKINANYILPFLTTIFLFGIIMISFTYSLYQNKLKKSSISIIIISIIITILVWLLSWKVDIGKPFTMNENIQYINNKMS